MFQNLFETNNQTNNQTKTTHTHFNQYLNAHIANEIFNCHVRQFIMEILKGLNAKMQILVERLDMFIFSSGFSRRGVL